MHLAAMTVDALFLCCQLIVCFLQHCGCVTFYMPRNPTQTPICSPEKLECIKEATDVVDKTAFDVDHDTETNCKCLPACSTYDYPFEISTGKMAKAELMHVDKKAVGERVEIRNTASFINSDFS